MLTGDRPTGEGAAPGAVAVAPRTSLSSTWRQLGLGYGSSESPTLVPLWEGGRKPQGKRSEVPAGLR